MPLRAPRPCVILFSSPSSRASSLAVTNQFSSRAGVRKSLCVRRYVCASMCAQVCVRKYVSASMCAQECARAASMCAHACTSWPSWRSATLPSWLFTLPQATLDASPCLGRGSFLLRYCTIHAEARSRSVNSFFVSCRLLPFLAECTDASEFIYLYCI